MLSRDTLLAELKRARTFIEYARYELEDGLAGHGDQFPKKGDADIELARIDVTITTADGIAQDRPCPRKSLADLPLILRVNGHRAIGDLAEEHLAKVGEARASLTAVIHQMEHGEASDVFELEVNDDTRRDLRWCLDQIREALKSLS